MAVTRTTLAKILKEDYEGPIRDQFNKKTLLSRLIRKNRRDFGGTGATIPLMTRRTHAHGARAEGGTLPTDASNQYNETIITPKYNYAKIKVTGPSISVARKDKYAFARTLNAEIRGVVEGFIDDYDRQCFGAGGGVLCGTGTTSSSTTVVLDTSSKYGGWGGTKFIQSGMLVDVRTESSGVAVTSGTGLTVSAVASGTITVDTAISTAATDAVYIAGNRASGAIYEVMGINGICQDQDPSTLEGGAGSLQGLAVASNAWWKASRVHNSGTNRALSLSLMHDLMIAIDKASGETSGSTCFISTHEQWKAFGLLMTGDRRYGGDPEVFEGGFKYLTFDGIKFFFDRHAWPHRILAPNFDHIKCYEESPIHWDETDGALLKWDGSTDGFVAFLAYYSNLGTDRRIAHGILEDLT